MRLSKRNGARKKAQSKLAPVASAALSKASHPAVAKLAVALREYKELAEQHAATAEILRVIARSPSNAQAVFEAIAKSARRLLRGHSSAVTRLMDGQLHLQAWTTAGGRGDAALKKLFPVAISGSGSVMATAARSKSSFFVADTETESAPAQRKVARLRGFRSVLGVPMRRGAAVLGTITVTRREPGAFSKRQIALLETFADQAVIAIENVRLFNETKESLERQTATSEILRAIASSPTDEQPVLDAIVNSAERLFGRMARIRLLHEGVLHLRAGRRANTDLPLPLTPDSLGGQVARAARALQITDVEAPGAPAQNVERGKSVGYRAIAVAPLMREGALVGVLSVSSPEPGALDDKQMALLQTFADQAVIAIENVRLFNETRHALERQTATAAELKRALGFQAASADILASISRSMADAQPVFDAIVASGLRLLGGHSAAMLLIREERLHLAAYTSTSAEGDDSLNQAFPMPLADLSTAARAARDRRTYAIEDVDTADVTDAVRETSRARGWRSALVVPLLRQDDVVGVVSITRRNASAFAQDEVALVETFAAQAVIAIENARLFNETREALEQQTATTEVLNVISSSITDARPVFDAIARSVLKLYGARNVGVVVRAGDTIDRVGYAVSDASADDGTQVLYPIPLDEGSLSGRAILRGEVIHIRDVETEEGLSEHSRAITRKTGARSVLVAPMYSMGTATGALAIARRSPGGFSEREVEMIRTFADQAVIAMENVRLFREIEEKSAQLKVASEHKSQFLASMSHELRTPLNALLGFNEMILGDIYGEVPADMRAPLLQMQASGKHLLRLINNVLDLAKIEAGRMELALADYSVQDIVDGVRSTLSPLAAEKGLELLAAVPADIPLAHGDSGRIAQCLMNLAGNSLKFTKAGKVEISVAADHGLLRYRVADTGIGIPADKMEGLFTEFKQTDAAIASEYGGTGLGLSISKKFVEMHGGRIWAESEPGKGSTFIFELPLRVAG